MQQVGNLNNVFQKRLIRPEYAQTQGYPYGAVLDVSLRNADGSFRKPLSTDSSPLARSADAFTLQNGLVPGTVVVKGAGEGIVVASGANAAEQPFGLLGNWVGGTFDDLKSNNEVGVWRGVDSTYVLLAPAFDDTGLAAAYASATPGNPVKLYAGTDGRLVANASPGNRIVVAHLLERISSAQIRIDLKV